MRRTNRSSVLCLRHHHHHRPRHHYRHQRLRRCRRHHRHLLVLSHHHYHLLFKKKKSSFPCSSSSFPLLQGRESRIIRGTNCFEKFKRSIYLWFLTTKRCFVLRITQIIHAALLLWLRLTTRLKGLRKPPYPTSLSCVKFRSRRSQDTAQRHHMERVQVFRSLPVPKGCVSIDNKRPHPLYLHSPWETNNLSHRLEVSTTNEALELSYLDAKPFSEGCYPGNIDAGLKGLYVAEIFG